MNRKKVSVGITAFIDILGFGNRVLSSNTLDDIEKIEKTLQIVRSAFDHETENEIILEAQKVSNIEILAFSDSVIINVPLKSKATKYSGTFDPIISEISGFAIAQGLCVQNNLFIRGGLDIGWWYKDKSTLISQSLTRAYSAEGKAKFPVIALTDGLFKYLTNHKDRGYYSKDYDPIKSLFRKASIEGKDIYYIDYIRIVVESIGWQRSKNQREQYKVSDPEEKNRIQEDGYRKNMEEWLISHASNIKEGHDNASKKDKVKYVWLADYHNEIAKQHSTNKECTCYLN